MKAVELRCHDADLTADRAFYQTAGHELVAPLPDGPLQLQAVLRKQQGDFPESDR